MTDPISPAEAATANAIDATNAEHATTEASLEAAAANADLLGSAPGTTDPMAIPHAQHIVPAAQVHHADDKPVVHAPLRTDGPTLEEWEAAGYKAEHYPPQGYAVNTVSAKRAVSAPPLEKSMSLSAQIQEKMAAGYVPPKRKYAYQRKRK